MRLSAGPRLSTVFLATVFALLLLTLEPRAEQPWFEDRVGDVYEIRLVSVSQSSGERSSGGSTSKTTLVERVIGMRDGGVELEFDLPERASEQDRARSWQFPTRVLKSPGQPLKLLNGLELEARVRTWLQSGGLTEAACGRWIFTWAPFKIECDPQSVLQTLTSFDLRLSDLREGALYYEAGALEPAPFRVVPADASGAAFVAELAIDPEAVRQEYAEGDVAVAEMTGQPPLELEVAIQAREDDQISGTIVTTVELDADGQVMRRTRVTHLEIADESGGLQSQTITLTVERRLVSRSDLATN